MSLPAGWEPVPGLEAQGVVQVERPSWPHLVCLDIFQHGQPIGTVVYVAVRKPGVSTQYGWQPLAPGASTRLRSKAEAVKRLPGYTKPATTSRRKKPHAQHTPQTQ